LRSISDLIASIQEELLRCYNLDITKLVQ